MPEDFMTELAEEVIRGSRHSYGLMGLNMFYTDIFKLSIGTPRCHRRQQDLIVDQ